VRGSERFEEGLRMVGRVRVVMEGLGVSEVKVIRAAMEVRDICGD
jgi:hypothetical protein